MIPLSIQSDLLGRFTFWLKRFTPPKQILGKPDLEEAEAKSLFRIILDHAPDIGWDIWWDKTISTLQASMMTRSWPAPGEVVRACRSAQAAMPAQPTGQQNGEVEGKIIQMITDWFHKHKDQMPGMGRSDRTAALIRNGLFKDEREARFWGFTLSTEQSAKAMQQAPGPAEQDHDRKVSAKFGDSPFEDRNGDVPRGFKTLAAGFDSHAAE